MSTDDHSGEAGQRLRVPPHSIEAEQSVLGGLLLDNRAWDRAAEVLREADFYRHEHRRIFATIGAMVCAGKPADVITVYEQMQRLGEAEDFGGMTYLNALAHSVPSAANIRRYAEIVRDRALQRTMIGSVDEALTLLWTTDDVGAAADRLATVAADMQRRQVRQAPRVLAEVMAESVDRLSRLQAGEIQRAWSTGFAWLDRALNGGLRPGLLYVLAARPAVGKSSFVKSIALNLAELGMPVLVLSQEMPSAEVADRAIAEIGAIDYGRLQRGTLDDDEWSRLADATERGSKLPLHIDDQPALRLSDIRSKARMVKGLKVLVLDYLQLAASSRRDANRNAEIEEISRGLKALAKDMRIAVIELSQLNREVEKRANKRPNLSDLRDSGAIEQDADVVMFLWPVREFKGEGRTIVGLSLDKNRQGQRGEIGLDFWGSFQRWTESTADISQTAPARQPMDEL